MKFIKKVRFDSKNKKSLYVLLHEKTTTTTTTSPEITKGGRREKWITTQKKNVGLLFVEIFLFWS